jgi:hypothetical protein
MPTGPIKSYLRKQFFLTSNFLIVNCIDSLLLILISQAGSFAMGTESIIQYPTPPTHAQVKGHFYNSIHFIHKPSNQPFFL